MIELSAVIGELRRELQQAMHAGEDEPLRVELGPVELGRPPWPSRRGGGGAKVRLWVIELSGTPRPARLSPNASRSPSSPAWPAPASRPGCREMRRLANGSGE